ncbi:MAG: GNAT family N-acetyltransferase [Pseudomonadota bacterium]
MADIERLIGSSRLTLEPQRAAHAEAMFEVLSDPAIYEHENAPPESLQWLRERFERLETRCSGDGSEQWLNWVLRERASDQLIGYVQATVDADGCAFVAYELGSAHWHRGLGSEAVAALIDELHTAFGVRTVLAVFKRSNQRSRRLLEGLGFAPASTEDLARWPMEDDEDLLLRQIGSKGAGTS